MKRLWFVGTAGLLALLLCWGLRPSPPATLLQRTRVRESAKDPRAAQVLQNLKIQQQDIQAPPPIRYQEAARTREVYWAADEAQVTLKPGDTKTRLSGRNEVLKARDAEILLRKPFPDRKNFVQWSEELKKNEGVREVRPVFYASARGWAERLEQQRLLLTRTVAVTLPPGRDAAAAAARHGARVTEKVSYLPDTYVLEVAGEFDALDVAGAMAAEGAPMALPQFAAQPRKAARRLFTPNDPRYASEQWHLKNTGQFSGTSGEDVNVEPAWDLTKGLGVVICIIDDGVQTAHPDLAANYLSALSIDINGGDADPNPKPTTPSPSNIEDDHGTAVAGVAAAKGNNSIGGSGAAPDASIAAIRLISDPVTPSEIASAMSHQNASIHIKSNSWGFTGTDQFGVTSLDDSFQHGLDIAAITDGAASGRSGKGIIYLWAAGNDGDSTDNTNYDAYCTRRQVISVGAVDRNGVQSFYSEPGAALFIMAPSSGGATNVGITTTDRTGADGYDAAGDYCVANTASDFGGTSSAAPLTAGVVALMLAANPALTWRDVQHVLVRTARKTDLTLGGWMTNSGGLQVSHRYGHGVVNAGAAVPLASRFGLAPAEQVASATSGPVNLAIPDRVLPALFGATVSSTQSIATALKIENVEIVVNLTHTYRGDLRFRLTSPGGTEVILADVRGDPVDDMVDWQFRSTLHWGEMSNGTWTLAIEDGGTVDVGTLDNWTLRVYGTPVDGSAPTAGTVNDGAAADAEYLPSTSSVTANWTGFADAQSGALGFEMQLERVSDSAVIRAYQGVGNVATATLTGLSLVPGETYRVRIRANNFEGLTADAVSDGFTVDGIPPSTPTLTLNTSTPTPVDQVDLSWTAATDPETGIASYRVERDGGSGFVEVGSNLALTRLDSGLGSGSYSYRVRAIDNAGNASSYSNTVTVVIDLTVPDTTITQAPPDPGGLTTVTFFYSSPEPLVSFQYSLDGGAFQAAGAGSQVLVGISLGTHTFQVRAFDAAGNVDASPATHSWTIILNPLDTAGPWMNNFDLPWAVTNWTLSVPTAGVGWAVDGTPSTVPGGAARTGPASLNYNNGSNYDNGAGAHTGTATSPPVSLAGMTNATFRFMCNFQMTDTLDARLVEIIPSSGPVIPLNLTIPSCTAGVWHEHVIPLNPGTMPSVTIRFTFTANATSNALAGWFIDDVSISDLQVNALAQFESGAAVALPVGGTSSTGMIEFRSQIAAGVTNPVRLEIEIVPVSSSFTGTATGTSTLIGAGGVLGFAIAAPDGAYKWRARTVNVTTSAASMWVDYGTNAGSATDFAVAVPSSGGGGGGGGCGALGLEALLIPLLALGVRRRRKA